MADNEKYGYEINEECSVKIGNNSYKGVSALNACYTICVSYARAKGWVDHDKGIAEDVGLDELRILLHEKYKEQKKQIESSGNEDPTRTGTAVKGSRVLLYFVQNPYPGRTGTQKRCLTIINALQQLGCQVTLFSHSEYGPYRWNHESYDYFQDKGVEVILYTPSQADEQFSADAYAQSPDYLNLRYHCPPGLVAQFSTVFNTLKPDVLFIFYAFSSGLIKDFDLSNCLTIMDSIDLFSLSCKLQYALNVHLGHTPHDPLRINQAVIDEDFFKRFSLSADEEEFNLYDSCDYTLVVSQHEAAEITRKTHKTKAEYLPITFPVPAIQNSYAGGPVFVAANNPFNVQAYLYFACRVLPRLAQDNPQFELTVAGEVIHKLVPTHGINLKGFVSDLKELYAGACCAVCPIIGGTGMSVKVIEAMAHGVPVVVLRNNSQESPVRHGIDGFVANNAEEFAYFVSLFFRDRVLCARMGAAARDAVLQNFSDSVVVKKLGDIIGSRQNPCQVMEPVVIIDGVIFQLQHGRPFGISRLWLSMLSELGKLPIGRRIILLNRGGTAPDIPGIRKRKIDAYNIGNAQNEAITLDRLCAEEQAGLFLSTYYTFTSSTPAMLMLYDMIPERFDTVGSEAPNPEWRDKYHAIVNSTSFAAISQSTARDLATFYPEAAQRPLTVVPCAVSDDFRPHSPEEIAAFKAANGIDRPYYLLVGRRDPHKNAALFFHAFAQLPDRERYAIVMAGGGNALEPELRELAGPAAGYAGFFSDQDLSLAYSGAIALVYPSLYEGFGLPILEAMQSGCPVITCQNSSLSEVAGSAALYVGEYDCEEMTKALLSVQRQDIRSYLIKRGLERASLFSWQKSAELLTDVIRKSVVTHATLPTPGGN